MARIRTIKPSMWESEKLGKLSLLSRLNFVALISLADDEGRGRGSPRYLLGRIHPYQEGISEDDMGLSMGELAAAGLIDFYEEGGFGYYAIKGWDEHQFIQRPSKSSIPPFMEASRKAHGTLMEDSRKAHGSLHEGSGQDKEGKGRDKDKDVQTQGSAGADFNEFWRVYPKRMGKQDALRAWSKLKVSGNLLDIIIAAVKAQSRRPEWMKDGGQFVPLPATWLNGRRWEDEVGVPDIQSHPDGSTESEPRKNIDIYPILNREYERRKKEFDRLKAEGKMESYTRRAGGRDHVLWRLKPEFAAEVPWYGVDEMEWVKAHLEELMKVS